MSPERYFHYQYEKMYKNVSELINAVEKFEINSSLFEIANLSDAEFADVYENTEFVIIDTETTGLVGEIIDLGAVIVKGNKIRLKDGSFVPFKDAVRRISDVDFFGYLIFPKPIIRADGTRSYVIPEIITEITHIDLPLLERSLNGTMPNKSSYDFVEVFSMFMDFVGTRPVVAHNFQFDIGRIKQALGKDYATDFFERADHSKIERFLSVTTIDTLKDAKKILKVNDTENHKNSVLSKKYGVEADDSMLHRAYYDTFFTGSVFFGLMKDAREIFDEMTRNSEIIETFEESV